MSALRVEVELSGARYLEGELLGERTTTYFLLALLTVVSPVVEK